MESKNKEKLSSFSQYCIDNPDQRFWQALRNWNMINNNSDEGFILTSEGLDQRDGSFVRVRDTFYRE
jgi:hypothetical protein